jgi:ubiquinone biosynthesis UbiH/UbiF/VisC/COQ6 family hydroxylase
MNRYGHARYNPVMLIHSDICIIGGGAIGKTAALALARAGMQVSLVTPATSTAKPASSDHWDQRVFALNHVAHGLLSSLKVWEAMDATRIAPVDAMAVHGDGASAGHIGFNAYAARTDALAWIVEDQNLNQALDSALKFANGVRIIQSTAMHLYSDEHHAAVTLQDGSQIHASLIVGADGAQSWVRSQADIDIDYRAYNQRAIVANFSCEQPHYGVASQWFLGEQGIVALLPLPDSRVSLVWSAPDKLAETILQEPPEQLCQRLAQLPGQTLGAFTMLPPTTPQSFALRFIRAGAMVANRVALIGDAAHVVHPLAGQGMNLGFGDIDALLTAVAKRDQTSDCGDARTLARYARHRKEEVLLMQLTTDGLQRLFDTELAPLKVLRNLGMTALDKLPFLKRQLITHAIGRSI